MSPFILEKYGQDILTQISNKYNLIKAKFQELYHNDTLIQYVQDDNSQKLFELHSNIFVDIRIHEIYLPTIQKIEFDCNHTTKKPTNENLFDKGEKIDDCIKRATDYIKDINEKFKTKTILTVSHGEIMVSLQKYFRDFDYIKNKQEYYIKNCEYKTHYFDNTTQKEIDLHRPHVDNYRFNID
jgi:vacuolar-type H+-ATPase subunit D/Vma8